MGCGKSLLYMVDATPQAIIAGGNAQLGTITRRYGNNIQLNGDSVGLMAEGYYLATVSATVLPVADTAITMTINENGMAVAGGSATTTPTAAGSSTQMTVADIPVRVMRCGYKFLTVSLSAAATINNISVTVRKA